MAKVFLLTGLSGAGKTTLATKLLKTDLGSPFVLLDGDEMRKGMCSDLGFSAKDRAENIRRMGEMAKLLAAQGYNVLIAAIAPYESLRQSLASIVGNENLKIIHIACPLEVCIRRDPKCNYQKALAGFLPNYTGVADIYETPAHPHLVLRTHEDDLESCHRKLCEFVGREAQQIKSQENPGR